MSSGKELPQVNGALLRSIAILLLEGVRGIAFLFCAVGVILLVPKAFNHADLPFYWLRLGLTFAVCAAIMLSVKEKKMFALTAVAFVTMRLLLFGIFKLLGAIR